jgi:hypothetical protein
MVECWPDGALNLRVKGGGAEVKSQKCVVWEKLARHEITLVDAKSGSRMKRDLERFKSGGFHVRRRHLR